MPFTNEDLKVMLDECIEELSALGYKTYPFEKIEFTKRGSKRIYGRCGACKKYYYDYAEGVTKNAFAVILINKFLSNLPDSERDSLKELVMHEAMHAIPGQKIMYKGKLQDNDSFGTPHGVEYDKIKSEVEKKYGYRKLAKPFNKDSLVYKEKKEVSAK